MQLKPQNSPYFTATYEGSYSSLPGLRRLAFFNGVEVLVIEPALA